MPHPRADDLTWPSRRTVLLLARRIVASAWATYAAVTIALLIANEPVLPAQLSATLQLILFACVWACSYALHSMNVAAGQQRVMDDIAELRREVEGLRAELAEDTRALPRLRVAGAVIATATVPEPVLPPDNVRSFDLGRKVERELHQRERSLD